MLALGFATLIPTLVPATAGLSGPVEEWDYLCESLDRRAIDWVEDGLDLVDAGRRVGSELVGHRLWRALQRHDPARRRVVAHRPACAARQPHVHGDGPPD